MQHSDWVLNKAQNHCHKHLWQTCLITHQDSFSYKVAQRYKLGKKILPSKYLLTVTKNGKSAALCKMIMSNIHWILQSVVLIPCTISKVLLFCMRNCTYNNIIGGLLQEIHQFFCFLPTLYMHLKHNFVAIYYSFLSCVFLLWAANRYL